MNLVCVFTKNYKDEKGTIISICLPEESVLETLNMEDANILQPFWSNDKLYVMITLKLYKATLFDG